MINLTFVLLSLKGRCYGKQPILRARNGHRLIPASFFGLTYHNELEYRHQNARTSSGDDGATSFEHLVNFPPVTSKMTGLICVPVYLYRAKNSLSTFIRCTRILKQTAISQFRFQTVNRNHLPASYKIWVRFGQSLWSLRRQKLYSLPASRILPRLVQLSALPVQQKRSLRGYTFAMGLVRQGSDQ